ncbi:MAG: choline-sulfatase [Alteromonas macleodii]|jgi:choline-sulfatase
MKERPQVPNLALIYIDDLFTYRLFRGTFGQPIQTPHLDKLCDTATTFNAAYAFIPICGPSRASAMTGWSPFESGVHSNHGQEWYNFIPTRDNLSSVIKRAGHYVVHAGKIMHGYYPQPVHQQRQMHHEVMPRGEFFPSNVTDDEREVYFESPLGIEGIEGHDDRFYDARVAQYGIDALERLPDDRPWTIMMGFQHPHTRYIAPKWCYEKYDLDLIQEPKSWALGDLPRPTTYAEQFMGDGTVWPGKNFEAWQHHVRAYLACITHMDYEVGRFLTALEASGKFDDTAIVVVSDHGYHVGDHDVWGKFTLWEEAARTPLIVKMPGQTKGNEVDEPVSLMDIFPTCLDIIGEDIPARIKAQSLRPLLPDQPGEYESRGALSSVYGATGIRAGDYRYILYPNGDEEMYNVVADPVQSNNLTDQTELMSDMRSRLVVESARNGLFHTAEQLPPIAEAMKYALQSGAKVHGGTGDDAYFLWEGADVEITDDGGNDTIYLGGWQGDTKYTLPDGIENLFLAVKRAPTMPEIHLNNLDNRVDGPQRSYIGYGYGGNDIMTGPNKSTLYGGHGDDEIHVTGHEAVGYGEDGDDVLTSRSGAGIYGGAGNDTLTIVIGEGSAYGGSGEDKLFGGENADTLDGGSGDDYLEGGMGDDLIIGGPGLDTMFGGLGRDTLVSLGDDTLFGGKGVDTFIIGRAGSCQIGDWEIGEEINLTAWDAIPEYRQITDHSVLIWHKGRSVVVNSEKPFTIKDLQGAVVF